MQTIDSLVISLGLDASQFTEGQRAALDAFKRTQEAAVAGGKNIEAQGKKATEYLSNLKREALTLLAVVAGGKGMVEMTNHIMNLDASTGRLARTFGIATESLATWQIMMREVGGSNESARGSVGGIQAAIATAQATGQWDPKMAAVLSRIGLPQGEAFNDPMLIMDKLAEFSHSPGMTGPRFAALANMIPGMNQDTINLLSDPRYKELKANAVKVTPHGGGLGPESEKFQERFALFATSVDNLARAILERMIPVMDKISDLLSSIYNHLFDSPEKSAKQYSDLHDTVGAKFGNSTDAARKLFGGLPPWLVELIMGPKTAAELQGGGSAVAAAPAGRRNAFAPGETITGIQLYSDEVGGARGAAATSTVNNRSSRSSSKTDVTIHNVNLPGVKNAQQFIGGLDDVISLQSHGAPVNSGPQ